MMSECPVDPTTLDAYVDGELPRSEQDALERHLRSCERCERVVHASRALRTLVGSSATEPPLPLELAARVRRDLTRARELERFGRLRPRLASAALVLLGLTLGFAAGRFSAAPKAPPPVAESAAVTPSSARRAIFYPDANRIETVSVLPESGPAAPRLPEGRP